MGMSMPSQAPTYSLKPPPMGLEPPKTCPTPSAVMSSEALFMGRKVLDIEHNGVLYRLQATKLGKLILTK